MAILQTIQSAQISTDMKKSILLAYAAIVPIVGIPFETFLNTVVTQMRSDLGAIEQAARALKLTEEQQVGLLAIYLDSQEQGSTQKLGGVPDPVA